MTGREIVEALGGRLILNIGDILPANGRLARVIELGEFARSAGPLMIGEAEPLEPGPNGTGAA